MPYRLDEPLFRNKNKSLKHWIWVEEWLLNDDGSDRIYTENYSLINLVNLLKGMPRIVHPYQNSMLMNVSHENLYIVNHTAIAQLPND